MKSLVKKEKKEKKCCYKETTFQWSHQCDDLLPPRPVCRRRCARTFVRTAFIPDTRRRARVTFQRQKQGVCQKSPRPRAHHDASPPHAAGSSSRIYGRSHCDVKTGCKAPHTHSRAHAHSRAPVGFSDAVKTVCIVESTEGLRESL